MICPGCGKLLPDGSRFCDDCGARLAEAPVSASPVFSEAPAAELESPAPKKKARWLLPPSMFPRNQVNYSAIACACVEKINQLANSYANGLFS